MKKDTLQHDSSFTKLLTHRITNNYILFIFLFSGNDTLEFAISLTC